MFGGYFIRPAPFATIPLLEGTEGDVGNGTTHTSIF
jgi:hypothetical protein